MPEWAEDDPRGYWAGADAHERANGRLYREVEFALPRELNAADRVELATRFAEHLTGKERLPYTLAVHRGGQDGGNPHAHLMISERANDGIERSREQWFKRYNAKYPEKGGARKSTSTKPRDWLEQTREDWADQANEALDRAGRPERINEASLKDQYFEAAEAGDERAMAHLNREPGCISGRTTWRGPSAGRTWTELRKRETPRRAEVSSGSRRRWSSWTSKSVNSLIGSPSGYGRPGTGTARALSATADLMSTLGATADPISIGADERWAMQWIEYEPPRRGPTR